MIDYLSMTIVQVLTHLRPPRQLRQQVGRGRWQENGLHEDARARRVAGCLAVPPGDPLRGWINYGLWMSIK